MGPDRRGRDRRHGRHVRLHAPQRPTASAVAQIQHPDGHKDASTNVAFSPQISPDGRYLVYLSEKQIWVRDLASMVSRPLPGTEGAHYPFWSPDNDWIGFSTSSELKKIDRSGGQSTIPSTTPPATPAC